MKLPPGKISSRTAVRDWDGEWLPLLAGVSYRLEVIWKQREFKVDAAQIFVRFKPANGSAAQPSESEVIAAPSTGLVVTGKSETAWAQICIRSADAPGQLLDSVKFCRED
jgi:hypothetical protein